MPQVVGEAIISVNRLQVSEEHNNDVEEPCCSHLLGRSQASLASLVDVLLLDVPEQPDAAPPPQLRDDARPDVRRPPQHQPRQRVELPASKGQRSCALTACRAAAARGSGRRA